MSTYRRDVYRILTIYALSRRFGYNLNMTKRKSRLLCALAWVEEPATERVVLTKLVLTDY